MSEWLVNDWMSYPETCSATILRGPRHDKEEDACGKPAVAVAAYKGEEFEHHLYPVCKHHARGRNMLSLVEVIAAVREYDSR